MTKLFKKTMLMVAFSVVAIGTQAQAPTGINYQAAARNASGSPMMNKTIAVRLSILAGSASGTADYVEKHSVSTNQFGLFNLIIGGGSAQTGTFANVNWSAGSKFLKVEIDTNNGNSFTTLSSTQMMSVPYALYAQTSGSGGGGLTGSGTNNFVSKWNSGTSLTNSQLFDDGSNVAIGTSTPTSTNKFHATSSSTITGYFENTNGANTSIGLQGRFNNSGQYDGVGVSGISKPQDSYGIGGSFEGGWMGSFSQVLNAGDSNYTGSYGRVISASSATGQKIGARGSVTGAYGLNWGGHFQATGDTNAIGVVGIATAATHRTMPNVYARGNAGGLFSSNDGQGIYASAIGSYTYNGNKSCVGVVGFANDASGYFNEGISAIGTGGSNTCTGINARGIVGSTTPNYVIGMLGSTNGTGNVGEYAGYFIGNVEVTGSVAKAGGSFKIDHPLDPSNKYLYHSFVESPDMMNIYNGNITTDANGLATVSLPSYFMAENKDFRYQLTVIGTFAQAIVFEEVKDNQFVIKTNAPNVKVSWQVTGIRQDAWANANRIQTEVDKKGVEKGKYMHPELYGKPQSMGIFNLVQNPVGSNTQPDMNLFDLSKTGSSKKVAK